MDNFTQFQLKEYENISQAHFKTNEVLATFYRYFIIITAIPITTIGLALMNLSAGEINDDARILAHLILGFSAIILSVFGIAVIAYIESLRLDAILYARVVNSIRNYFFKYDEATKFGPSILPTDVKKPSYNGFGASFFIYHICALMNSAYLSVGVLVLSVDKTTPLNKFGITKCQLIAVILVALVTMTLQIIVRRKLISAKGDKGV